MAALRDDAAWTRSDAVLDGAPQGSGPVLTDDERLLGVQGPVQASDLLLLASIDPASLSSQQAKLAYVRLADRAVGLVVSLRHRAEVALVGEEAGPEFLPEVHAAHEVAVARRTSRHAASTEITVARRLATVFTGFGVALRAGEVSEAHCASLVAATRHVSDPDVLAAIEARVLPGAGRVPASRFATTVAAAVADLDTDATARVREARAARGVSVRQLEDGMGRLTVIHDWSTIHALAATTESGARALQLARGGASRAASDPDVALGACRADAFAARHLGTTHDDGSVTFDPSHVEVVVNVVVDLDTLRGEAARVALLDDQPVPAAVARDAVEAATWWRRLVTDPVDGHLLDYGRLTYLPNRLRRYVMARDDACRAPMCTTRASTNLQMDHAIEFPDGPSDTTNCGTLCPTCHQLKTHGHTDITDSRADGSATWTTLWGQTIHIPPRPVLPHDPAPPP